MRRPALHRTTLPLLAYLFYLAALTLAPFDFSRAVLSKRIWALGERVFADFVLNALVFVPLGVLLCVRARSDYRGVMARFVIASGASALLSLLIEVGQMFLETRYPSPADLAANTLGGGAGFWLASQFQRAAWITRLQQYRRALAYAGLALYLGAFGALIPWTAGSRTLDDWDPTYPLLLGNEATEDKPWLGKIFLVALYDRILHPDEIESQFRAGARAEPEAYLRGAPIALYPFREGMGTRVHDRSGSGPPLDLEIADVRKAGWLFGGGVDLLRPTSLRTLGRPDKVHERFTATASFSVVLWIEPKDALQSGPARVISFSRASHSRNFTIGQQGSEIHFRVRNRVAGLSGDRLNVRTSRLKLGPRPTHIVAAYDRGTELLYVNGKLVQRIKTHDALTFIVRLLGFNTASPGQRVVVVMLLLGPVGGCWLLIRGDRGKRRRELTPDPL